MELSVELPLAGSQILFRIRMHNFIKICFCVAILEFAEHVLSSSNAALENGLSVDREAGTVPSGNVRFRIVLFAVHSSTSTNHFYRR